MRKRQKIYLGMAFLAMIGMGLLFYVYSSPMKRTANTHRELQKPVTVMRVQAGSTVQYYETSGTIKASTVSKVAPKAMGQVTALYVKAGDRVEAGQILAELEDEELLQKALAADAGMKEAEKGLQLAQRNRELQVKTHNRYEELYRRGAISQQQVDEVRTQRDLADLASEQAQAALERSTATVKEVRTYSRMLAPVSGVVTEKNLELGSMALPGIWAIVVEDDRSFFVECYVEGSLAGKIWQGQAVLVDVEGLEKSLPGTVTEVVPAMDAASRSFLVKISVTNPLLKTGQYSKVRFPLGQRQAMVLPRTSLVEKGQLTGVYILDGEKRLWYRLVRTGKLENDQMEVISGLQSGDYVVVQGMEAAVDGALAGEVTGL
ncbi:MAG TPA: efflux RND transporter periplasmic adaptor subunit [Patescibacteria group bacterium]|nr:efflux RND transporter periplasmic adaptor subunit [Patescibacteria group bacterium]